MCEKRLVTACRQAWCCARCCCGGWRGAGCNPRERADAAMDLWQLLGDLTPKLVHFPLVLLLAGLLFDSFGLIARSERAHWAAKALTVAGTEMLLFSFICGIYAEIWAGRALIPHHQIELHELAANVA